MKEARKKRILLIGTGGTIASELTESGGLAPELTTEELLARLPAISDICETDCLQLLNLDSTSGTVMRLTTASCSPTAPTPWPTRRRPSAI